MVLDFGVKRQIKWSPHCRRNGCVYFLPMFARFSRKLNVRSKLYLNDIKENWFSDWNYPIGTFVISIQVLHIVTAELSF